MYLSKLHNGYFLPLIKKTLLACFFISCPLLAAETSISKTEAGLFYQTQSGDRVSAPLLSSDVEMHVNGLINRVRVTQVFKNGSDQWIDATYLFPLPENAAVDHLAMTIGERVIIGEIKKKLLAKRIYAEAKNAGKKASLIAQQRADIFRTAVANIAPGERVSIEIEYQQTINYKMGVFTLYYPMAITPRYAPPMPRLSRAQRDDFLSSSVTEQDALIWDKKWDSWLRGTEAQQLAEQTEHMMKMPSEPDLLVNIRVYLDHPLPIKEIDSPYHTIKIEQQNTNRQLISLQQGPAIAARDFVLNWRLQQGDKAQGALFVQDNGAEKYGALMLLPPAVEFTETARINKEVLFVIDVSGSMSGTSIKQAKSALSFAIDQLAENDTFNIISFSHDCKFFASNALPADRRSKIMAKVFIDQLQASGGTNMQSALQAALVGQRTVYADKEQGLRQVLFITDASISNEQQLLTQIKQQLGESRLFMVGIGSAPNHYFMKSSAKLGKGTYINIGDVNEVERKMSFLFSQLSTPVLRDIRLNWADGSKVDYWPQPIGDLYQGDPLQLVFKIPQKEKVLHISGLRYVDGSAKAWSQVIPLQQQENAQGIDLLWAKQQIDSIDLNRAFSDTEKQRKITALGLAFHIVTQHTSLVAVEQKISRPANIDPVPKEVKTHLPHPQRKSMNLSRQRNAMSLPQTGLASELYKNLGLLLLMLAALLRICELSFLQLSNAAQKVK